MLPWSFGCCPQRRREGGASVPPRAAPRRHIAAVVLRAAQRLGRSAVPEQPDLGVPCVTSFTQLVLLPQVCGLPFFAAIEVQARGALRVALPDVAAAVGPRMTSKCVACDRQMDVGAAGTGEDAESLECTIPHRENGATATPSKILGQAPSPSKGVDIQSLADRRRERDTGGSAKPMTNYSGALRGWA
jgi:hypothetical protein